MAVVGILTVGHPTVGWWGLDQQSMVLGLGGWLFCGDRCADAAEFTARAMVRHQLFGRTRGSTVMGGWSGGVYTRFRNWVSDKANSINPQAALFDQEDDGFAGGLNNCVTKDGLNKPSSAMDWNGQNLTGVLNFANTGTVSLVGGKLTLSAVGVLALTPTSGVPCTITGNGTNIVLALANSTTGSGSSIVLDTTNTVDADFKVTLSQAGAASKFATLGPSLAVALNLQTGNVTRAILGASNTPALQFNDETGTIQA